MDKGNNGQPAGKGHRTKSLRWQALALALFLTCPVAAYFAWQAGSGLLSVLFAILVGLAFLLTIL